MSGRKKTSGNYPSRAILIEEIAQQYAIGLPWHIIAKRCGVSTTTATRLHFHPETR